MSGMRRRRWMCLVRFLRDISTMPYKKAKKEQIGRKKKRINPKELKKHKSTLKKEHKTAGERKQKKADKHKYDLKKSR
uniref:Uncharacterized protein n=1 Tax=Rhipicephalus microplus TaxID=6941 RepID=A0A6M2CTE0_RHIMP